MLVGVLHRKGIAVICDGCTVAFMSGLKLSGTESMHMYLNIMLSMTSFARNR